METTSCREDSVPQMSKATYYQKKAWATCNWNNLMSRFGAKSHAPSVFGHLKPSTTHRGMCPREEPTGQILYQKPSTATHSKQRNLHFGKQKRTKPIQFEGYLEWYQPKSSKALELGTLLLRAWLQLEVRRHVKPLDKLASLRNRLPTFK